MVAMNADRSGMVVAGRQGKAAEQGRWMLRHCSNEWMALAKTLTDANETLAVVDPQTIVVVPRFAALFPSCFCSPAVMSESLHSQTAASHPPLLILFAAAHAVNSQSDLTPPPTADNMDAILSLQKQHLRQWQQGAHTDHMQERQRDATIILALHYSHSANLLLAGTHRGILHTFHSTAIFPPPHDKRQPLPSTTVFQAHEGAVNCMDSTNDWLITGGDDIIHVWSLAALRSLDSSSSSPSALLSITPAQYRLAGRALTAVPRTLSVLLLPSSSLLVSAHSNSHVLVTDLRTSTTVADLTCSSSHPATVASSASASSSALSILYMPQPYHVLLVGGSDGYVRVYECNTWQPTATYDVTSNTTVTATTSTSAASLPSRPAITALSTATTAASQPSSLVLCLTAAPTLHAFYYPSLTALPPLPLPSLPALLHNSLLFTADGTLQRVHPEPSLSTAEVRRAEHSGSGSGSGGVSACCVRSGGRAAVDDVLFVGGGGGRIDVLGCMGSVDMCRLQCR